MPSAAVRSLVAYQGTVLPRHGLDEGERSSGGEGLQGVRWAANVHGLSHPKPSPASGLVRGRDGIMTVIVPVAW